MVFEHQGSYETRGAAVAAIAPKIGCISETLWSWVRQSEKDGGARDGATSAERERIKELEREVLQLRQASAYFAPPLGECGHSPAGQRAELDRPFKPSSHSSMISARITGSSRFAEYCQSLHQLITLGWLYVLTQPRLLLAANEISTSNQRSRKSGMIT